MDNRLERNKVLLVGNCEFLRLCPRVHLQHTYLSILLKGLVVCAVSIRNRHLAFQKS